MRIQDVYTEYVYRLNKLGTNAGKNVQLPQFVSLINKAQLHWVESRVKVAEGQTVRVDEIQQLLKDYKFTPVAKTENFYKIPLPADYFHRHRGYGQVSGCDGVVYFHFVEEGNINVLLQNEFSAPSATWEETLVTVFGNQLRIYFKDFSLSDVFLKYYRLPITVDIEGYETSLSQPSTSIDLEFNDVNAQEIIDLAVQLASADIGDIQRHQLSTQQIQQNN